MFWFHIVRKTSIRKSLMHSNLLALRLIAAANLVLVHCNTQCCMGINLAVTSDDCPIASLSLLCSNSNFLLSVWLSSFSEHVHQLRFSVLFSAFYSHFHIPYIHLPCPDAKGCLEAPNRLTVAPWVDGPDPLVSFTLILSSPFATPGYFFSASKPTATSNCSYVIFLSDLLYNR